LLDSLLQEINQRRITMSPNIRTTLHMLLISSVYAENMKWGPNPDLVDEVDKIQGRENNKMAVVMQGEDIRLECRVTATSDPPKNIVWKIDGRKTNDHEQQMVEKDEDDVHLKGHLELKNITKDMDGKTVTCAYSKGRYADSIEVILRVFSLNIEASEKACKECRDDTNVKLVFKESIQKSPAESTVDERIKAKIKDLTKADDIITVNTYGYSVSAPASILKDPAVTALTPTISVDGEQVQTCKCASADKSNDGDGGGSSLYGLFAIIPAAMIVFLVYWVSPARGGSWGWRRQDDHGGSFQLPSSS